MVKQCTVTGCSCKAETDRYVKMPYKPRKIYYCKKHSIVIREVRDMGRDFSQERIELAQRNQRMIDKMIG